MNKVEYKKWASLFYGEDLSNIKLALSIYDGFADKQKEKAINTFLSFSLPSMFKNIKNPLKESFYYIPSCSNDYSLFYLTLSTPDYTKYHIVFRFYDLDSDTQGLLNGCYLSAFDIDTIATNGKVTYDLFTVILDGNNVNLTISNFPKIFESYIKN